MSKRYQAKAARRKVEKEIARAYSDRELSDQIGSTLPTFNNKPIRRRRSVRSASTHRPVKSSAIEFERAKRRAQRAQLRDMRSALAV